MIVSVIYVTQLFDFDKKVSRIRSTDTMIEKTVDQPRAGISDLRPPDSMLEAKVANALTSSQISFEMHPRIQGPYRPDFAIPSSKKPRFFVETKGSLTKESTVGWLNYDARALRSAYPQVKMVIVSKELTAKTRRLLSRYWDYIFEESQIDDLVEVVKSS